MLFLQPLFEYVEFHYSETINHFYLVKLIFQSLDRTILYFLMWFLIRGLYRYYRKHKATKSIPFDAKKELVLNVFVFYLILLIHLTVFRVTSFEELLPIHLRPFSVINWQPFVHTLKLVNGDTMFSYYYNLYGNIFWFIPMGFGTAYLLKKPFVFVKAMTIGFLFSALIETLQYLFNTGITDIDDVLFNTTGTFLGVLSYFLIQFIKDRKLSKKSS